MTDLCQTAFREKCSVVKNEKTAPGHYTLTLRSKKISSIAQPGQFIQLSCSGNSLDPFLPRPFSFLTSNATGFSVLYHVVGKGTERMAQFKKGDEIFVLGPLGNGFSLSSKLSADGISEKRILVGGGVGIPPLYHLAETLLRSKKIKKENIHVFLGARNKSLLLCQDNFKKLGVNLEVATEDGSKGRKGYVTAPLTDFLRASEEKFKTKIHTCGPTPMLRAVSQIAAEFNVFSEVAVEVPMACGFGACLGCAIKLKQTAGSPQPAYRYAIACTEGPVFDGASILWE